jgi:hypothetical protein
VMDWPAAIVLVALILGGVSILATQMAARSAVAAEEAKGKYGEQYRMIAADYETLAKETKDAEIAIQADIAAMRQKVESIEAMMREVG